WRAEDTVITVMGGTSMELLDRYVSAVKTYLPDDQQDDIAKERSAQSTLVASTAARTCSSRRRRERAARRSPESGRLTYSTARSFALPACTSRRGKTSTRASQMSINSRMKRPAQVAISPCSAATCC